MAANTCGPATEMGQHKAGGLVHKSLCSLTSMVRAALLAIFISSSLALCRCRSGIGGRTGRLTIFLAQVSDVTAPAIVHQIPSTGTLKNSFRHGGSRSTVRHGRRVANGSSIISFAGLAIGSDHRETRGRFSRRSCGNAMLCFPKLNTLNDCGRAGPAVGDPKPFCARVEVYFVMASKALLFTHNEG